MSAWQRINTERIPLPNGDYEIHALWMTDAGASEIRSYDSAGNRLNVPDSGNTAD